MNLTLSLTTLALAQVVAGQQTTVPQPPKANLRILIDSVQPKEEARQLPGDRVFIDPSTNDIVFESGTIRRTYVRKVHVKPVIGATYEKADTSVRYQYTVSNGAGAAQTIESFAMDIRLSPGMTVLGTAPHWSKGERAAGLQDLGEPGMTVFMWYPVLADGDERATLRPGATVGPFILQTSALPGLVAVHVWGHQHLLTDREENELFEGVSPWVREQTIKAAGAAQNRLIVYALGPKIAPSDNRVEAVRHELAAAAKLPEFVGLSAALAGIAQLESATGINVELAKLKGTPFQQEFIRAMLFDLQF